MAHEKLFHVGVKGLITNAEGKILVLNVNTARFRDKTDEGHWDIPGGRIQVGSDVKETLTREITEETGVSAISDIGFFTAVISNLQIPISETERVGLVLMIYKVTIPEDSQIVLNEENTEYEWVTPAEAALRLAVKYPAEFTSLL